MVYGHTAAIARPRISVDDRWADDIERAIISSCHPWQADGILDPARFLTYCVGRGGGKTTLFKGRYLRGMARIPRAKFVYVAPTLGAAVKLLWEPLKDTVHALELGDEVEFLEAPRAGGKICRFERNEAVLHLLGAEDKRDMEKLRGQPFDGVGIDEAASFRPDLLDWFIQRIITPRLGERRGWLALAGTPGHILASTFYDASRPSSPLHRPYAQRHDEKYVDWKGWSSHAWSLADVMALPDAERWPAIVANWTAALEEKEKNGWTDDNPIWMREYLGQWATDASELVYKYRPHLEIRDESGKVVGTTPWNQWDPPRVGALKLAQLPDTFDDWNYGFGIDLGSKDPFACCVFAVSPSDPTHTLYHVWEVEHPDAHARTIAEILLGEGHDHTSPRGLIGALGWPNGIVVDVASLGGSFLKELSDVYGIRCIPSARKPGEKHSAIELFNGGLIDGRVKIMKGSKLEQQLQQLRWKEDEFRMVKEDPAQANHVSDAAIYARQVLQNILGAATSDQPPALKQQAPQPAADEPQPRAKRQDQGFGRMSPSRYYDPFR